jgi:hypothetical protein
LWEARFASEREEGVYLVQPYLTSWKLRYFASKQAASKFETLNMAIRVAKEGETIILVPGQYECTGNWFGGVRIRAAINILGCGYNRVHTASLEWHHETEVKQFKTIKLTIENNF